MQIEEQVIVISGATGGLGRVVTKELAKERAKLVLLGRDTDRLHQLVSDIDTLELNSLSLQVDQKDFSNTKEAAEAVLNKFGKVDALIHLVGGWIGGVRITNVDATDITNMLQQHLWTTFHLVQAFVPSMIEAKWGRIIGVSSPFSFSPKSNGGPYSIGKAAQESLLLTLAQELKGSGVTANILLIKTIDLNHQRENAPSNKNASWTTPEEISKAIKFLISDESRMINGARLPMYGSP
jgi:NAD(P)-dependent dehydrogenase (short-subunit alcohol dehydrogenase family)